LTVSCGQIIAALENNNWSGMREQIKGIALKHGADLFGIAPVDRFDGAPEGFHPRNLYSRAESVIVFSVKLPT
jgi:epoxyqueuosine reductase